MDILLAGLKSYADYKIQKLSGPVAEAKAALDRAEANKRAADDTVTQVIRSPGDFGNWNVAVEKAQQAANVARKTFYTAQKQYSEITAETNFYYSGAFYFGFLLSPIQTAETDADGKFVIEVPQTGRFAIAAQAKRSVGDSTERYYWLQPVSLEGKQQRTQNLSNNNLTRTTGASSLVLTQD